MLIIIVVDEFLEWIYCAIDSGWQQEDGWIDGRTTLAAPAADDDSFFFFFFLVANFHLCPPRLEHGCWLPQL